MSGAPTSANSAFTWLHLSDLHVGITGQEWLWPTLKHSFFDDMETQFRVTGPWDVVIFSGDLTQRGAADDFKRLDEVLTELWAKFKSLGFVPKLITLSGNHDLARANPLSSQLLLLRRWWDEREVQQDFFKSQDSEYRRATASLFEHYSEWSTQNAAVLPIVKGTPGLLPGDQSFVLSSLGGEIGIVCLNSTWLQLDAGDYEGKLHVDVRQLLAVTNNDPHAWCSRHIFNIIVTHHPLTWLHSESQSMWNGDINPPGRFDLHLFGHLHQARSESISTGGSRLRVSIQATSAFGLAYFNDHLERVHGYAIAKTTFEPERALRLWPRRLRSLASGERKLGPDLDF
jgi:predicted phosphodiesterase